MASRTEQERVRGKKLLLTAQTAGRKEQLEKGCKQGAREPHDVWSRQSFAQKRYGYIGVRSNCDSSSFEQ